LRKAVDKELSRVTNCPKGAEWIAKDALRYSVLTEGHRWRPILFLAMIKSAGGIPDKYLGVAAGLEIIHNSTLVIDDLPFVDNAMLRRNQPCCHIKFGVDVAVYASHLGFDLAEQLILDAAPDEAKQHLQKAIKDLKATLVAGQCIEKAFFAGRLPVTLRNLKKQYLFKSGALFKFGVQLVGVFSGLEQRNLRLLGILGEAAGVAYQIADDIADISGETSAIGKRTNMDAGKANYPRFGGRQFAVKELNKYHRQTMVALEDLFCRHVFARNKMLLAGILKKLHRHF
jgi:geranylgeranyl pyrophosphate synthase